MQTVRVGVIGVGGMGTFHARTLAALSGVELVAVADPHTPNADLLRDEFGCRTESDPMRLAVADDVDGLVIASPDETHAELAIAALGQQTMILCEKPLATTLADAMAVVDAEVSAGRRLVQLGFMREYDPAHVQLVDAISTSRTIDYLRAVHRNSNPTPRPIEIIVGQSLVHDIHTARFVTGSEIVGVHAFGSRAAGDSYRHVLAVCELASGAHAALEFDDGGFAYDVTVEVLTDDGDALTGPPVRAVTRHRGSIDVHLGTDWFGWFADAYRIQDQAWVDSIRRRTAVGPTTWDGVAAQAVVEAILTSLDNGEPCAVGTPPQPALYEVAG